MAVPFPVELRNGTAVVHARKGVASQVLIDGGRVVEVDSQGEDAIPLRLGRIDVSRRRFLGARAAL
ncbi:MAG: hypothetical protein HYZ53_15235 [Planctomycetes bacterium]|nr:hypothetical protein [Planctomycetota bacterium]